MILADLLREMLNVDYDEGWENERTPTPLRLFGILLHSMGLSVREVAAVLELLGPHSCRSLSILHDENEDVVLMYTDLEGEVDIRISHDLGALEEVHHWLGVNSPITV